MKSFTAVVERGFATGFYVGWVPGIAGAHSQGASLDELDDNLREVIAMLSEDGPIEPESEYVCTRSVRVG
ncbi:MAG TPA: type II toxin-antitoxin system HicB family antitoxin [Terriglobales bacterium]|nr:type II toxin-antitoxin system HicB family antitoxin [Terriglobales bacterium]